MRYLGRSMIIVSIVACLVGTAGFCSAGVVVRGEEKIELQGTPMAIAVATGGKMIFVLTDQGKVEIYADAGAHKGTIDVGTSASGIATSWRGDKLYVTDSSSKGVKIISLDVIAEFNTEASPSKGPENAPITIVEFSDFECPYCSRIAPMLERILKKYPKRVKLVFKNFPLTRIHKMAMKAAIASLAAKEQGRYWEYHHKLFENHKALSDKKLIDIASELGLDTEKFKQDMKNPRFVSLIERDTNEARQNGVRGTPTLFLNGHQLGSLNVRFIEQAIDREMKKICERKKQSSAEKHQNGEQNTNGATIAGSDSEDL